MRILVVGAGGIGGYFGGRLAAAGRDVTFLVRPKRAETLLLNGLSIRSPLGDAHIAQPRLVTSDRISEVFDLVLLGCKAYDIDDAIASLAPAVGPETAVLPTLNGMAHLDRLEQQFGAQAVLGGTCFISTTIAPDGAILHMNDTHRLSFGERAGGLSARIDAIAGVMADAGFQAEVSANIMQSMWDKWVFIASSAGMTCLMRSAIGDYVAAGASDVALQLIDECASVAAGQGFALDAAALERIRGMMTMAGSSITTSMLRDIEAGARIEAEQIIGDMIIRSGTRPPLLSLIHAHLRAYEIRREREGSR